MDLSLKNDWFALYIVDSLVSKKKKSIKQFKNKRLNILAYFPLKVERQKKWM